MNIDTRDPRTAPADVMRAADRVDNSHAVTSAHLDDTRAAYAYDGMRHDPNGAAAAYAAFRAETLRQWRDIMSAGRVAFTFHDGTDDYASSADMVADIERGHLFVRLSDADGLPADHPMAAPANTYGVAVRPNGDAYTVALSLNDVFRAVHDVMGHYGARGATHYSFGPNGERSAWLRHRRAYSRAALPALWCETRGQAAWTNDYADHRSIPLPARPFAVQKSGVPPFAIV